ncbi:MAG: PilZ domain-containing protein [Terriglobia bacterium]
MTDKTTLHLAPEDERRRSPRRPFTGEAWLHCEGREYILTARDVSVSGMGIAPASEPCSGSSGAISFCLDSGGLPLACRCRIIYSADGRGLGVEFLELSDEGRTALKNFVDAAN